MNALSPKQSPLSDVAEKVIDLPAKPSAQITITEKEYNELKWEIGYWKGMHKKALLREEELKNIVKEKDGKIRDLKNRLFGKKSEKKSTSKNEGQGKETGKKRPRGQQFGSKGHGRTARPDLPETDEPIDFPEVPKCPECGIPYIPLDESTDSEIIEVDVKAHKRIIKRKCAKKGCSCKSVPKTITAPMPPKVIPKSPYGISIWESVLLTKFRYCQPTNRLLNQYKDLGSPISAGTIAGGLKILKELFQPIYDALYSRQMTEDLFYNDESGWKVFESVDGKIGNRWYLWVSRSESVVYFQIAPGRGADVPVSHFENIQQQKIIVVCDRYSAYKSMAKQLPFILLAFCWAHVRRDFLDAARKYPELEEWALCWVKKIGELYHINKKRCNEFDKKLPIQWQPASFKKQHETLVEEMAKMAEERDAFINAYESDDPDKKQSFLSEVKYKILTSLQSHWKGLNIFVDHPKWTTIKAKIRSEIR